MRLIEILNLEGENIIDIDKLISDTPIIEHWEYKSNKNLNVSKILIDDEYSKDIIEKLEKIKNFRVIIYPIEATLPSVKQNQKEENKTNFIKLTSLSKEELNNDIVKSINLSLNYILMVIVSSVIAGIGILENNTAVIIGSMVVAPFLGPNIGLAFGTTLGDIQIIKKSVFTGTIATLIAFTISILWGYFSKNQYTNIHMDAMLSYKDLLLAFTCGVAGVLSIITSLNTSLVGIMVAASLLPPLMKSGMLFGLGDFKNGINSLLLFTTNIICLNIAGITTFYIAGIKPIFWWEKEKALKKTKTAFILWGIALLMLIIFIYLVNKY
jgi:uncharacterized hydrophobic protein (TIGR00341 family)